MGEARERPEASHGMNPISILFVDDDERYRSILSNELRQVGFDVTQVGSAEEAEEIVSEQSFDVALMDVRLPGMSGLEALHGLRERARGMEVIMLTAFGSIDDAVAAIREGAYNYMTKPCPIDQLETLIVKAHENLQLRVKHRALKQELARQDRFPEFVGCSEPFLEVLSLIERVAQNDSIILIQGESGVGKELAARAIHRRSHRSEEPFVVIDCTTLQESLLESELFGHEKGAYTGATSLKHGLFEVADGGTVFMDEVGELSLAIQAKLLRVIERSTFRRVGGTRTLSVDMRLIVATNRSLKELVEQKSFRADLFYRLSVFPIRIPPLRERRSDIPLLVQHFLEEPRYVDQQATHVSDPAMEILVEYDWPGNVRELENVIRRAFILCDDEVITPIMLPNNLHSFQPTYVDEDGNWLTLDEVQRHHIQQVLGAVEGHRAKAAHILGISERNLYRKLRMLQYPASPSQSV